VAGLVLALDELSQAWVVRNIPLHEVWVPFPALANVFWFRHVTNTGAAFGLFQGGGTALKIIAVVVILAIIAYTRYLPTERWIVQLSLGLQLGGAMGNLVDRFRNGRVVDFIDVPYWPTFNVADSCLVVGVIILALIMLFEREEVPSAKPADG
jgi:signal peptidase II